MMARKKWTAKAQVTENHLKFREKKKWQLALRRYVLEKNISASYAFYFGLSIDDFRKWIEIQFTDGLSWESFGSAWQFYHIVPVACFDFSIEEDLVLCWNFINIRLERIEAGENTGKEIDVIAAKPYFEALYKKTGYSICLKMIEKISELEHSNIFSEPAIEGFIIQNLGPLEILPSLSKEEFNSLNNGVSLNDVLLEREILKKFG